MKCVWMKKYFEGVEPQFQFIFFKIKIYKSYLKIITINFLLLHVYKSIYK